MSEEEGEETAGELEKKLAAIIIARIRSSKAKMDKMAGEIAGMKDLQERLLKKIREIPEEGIRRALYHDARRELKSILKVKHLLDITSVEEMAASELADSKVRSHFFLSVFWIVISVSLRLSVTMWSDTTRGPEQKLRMRRNTSRTSPNSWTTPRSSFRAKPERWTRRRWTPSRARC